MLSEPAQDRSDSETHALNNRPLLLGHRGARAIKSIPENTLASFDRALAGGRLGGLGDPHVPYRERSVGAFR